MRGCCRLHVVDKQIIKPHGTRMQHNAPVHMITNLIIAVSKGAPTNHVWLQLVGRAHSIHKRSDLTEFDAPAGSSTADATDATEPFGTSWQACIALTPTNWCVPVNNGAMLIFCCSVLGSRRACLLEAFGSLRAAERHLSLARPVLVKHGLFTLRAEKGR